ncbi:hypothetical protein M0802_001212 [Mischocyttarus mexicanus]|nr:hypothetical protein M0802_001212 [Mischocyttarus mexicanus]
MENRESEIESYEDDDESTLSVPTSGESSQPTTTFTAKDNTAWSKPPLIQHQTPTRNILRQRSGPHRVQRPYQLVKHLKEFSLLKWSTKLFVTPIRRQLTYSTSYPLYRAAMGINRFWSILRFIRFDDLFVLETQQEKQDSDWEAIAQEQKVGLPPREWFVL